MIKKHKKLIVLLIAFVFVLQLAACNSEYNIKKSDLELAYSTGINSEGKYDNSLFYRNDLNFSDAADPGVLYEDGWFYIYATTAPIRVWKTRNFANFEYLRFAFTPSNDSWAYGNYWAPEVIKNPKNGKYYMYYSASAKDVLNGISDADFNERLNLGVAVADNPSGPFHEWTGEREIDTRDEFGNATGKATETVTVSDQIFDFTQGKVAYELLKGKDKIFPAIDVSPFFDDNGDFYLYFVRTWNRNSNENSIWGVKMHDMVTPDYDTLTQLTEPGKTTVGGSKIDTEYDNALGETNSVNEAPFMTKHTSIKEDGTQITKYYLGFSIYGYNDRRYAVCTAVADSPLGYAKNSKEAALGGFLKLSSQYGQPTNGIDLDFDHVSGTAHHQYVEVDGELYIVYHAHKDRENGGTQRAIAADRAFYVYNKDLGFDIIHSNGPTYSLQPIPSGASGYKNIASLAKVSATNITDSSDIKLLTDNITVIHDYDDKMDFKTSSSTQITLEYDTARTVRAIMIYNGRDIELTFSKIDFIIFETDNGRYYIKDLEFPKEYIAKDIGIMRPGGAAVAEFKEINVKKIIISISEKISNTNNSGNAGLAISEITVLGK